ncbi:LysR family transcriptional regulator [Pseudomonas nitroreducens]|uniref:LysR family transcriptional regulator n=3 Tax=Pseudomonas nitroreducens TaxID=46680 RepID=A0A6G6IS08_PSENT|nr:LysR family transcriptional regulator [Pseudomonas nitroreducens]QIE85600.1 LysR family transcriptional regulator [Pseudomonas nitroreducens]
MSMNPTMMLLEEMVIFVRVVESGSFSEAARRLGISPSAASRGVSRLEKGLSVQLLQRTTRKLRLSESGEEIYKCCRSMVSSAKTVLGMSAKYSHEPEGLVRISAPKALGRFVIHPLIPEFLRLYPKVDVQLLLGDHHGDLIDSNLDLAVQVTDHPAPGLVGRCLFPIKQILCASPDYLAEHGVPMHPLELERHFCISEGDLSQGSRWQFKRGAELLKVQVPSRYSINLSEGRLDAVMQNACITYLPLFIAQAELERKRIAHLLPDWEFIGTHSHGSAWLLYQPTHYLPLKVRAVVDYLVEKVRGDPSLRAASLPPCDDVPVINDAGEPGHVH